MWLQLRLRLQLRVLSDQLPRLSGYITISADLSLLLGDDGHFPRVGSDAAVRGARGRSPVI